MSSFTNNGRLWRTTALALLIIAMFGPWTYEGVYMPSDAPCTWPNDQPAGHPYCGIALPVLFELAGQIPLTAGFLSGEVAAGQWVAQAALPLMLGLSIVALGAMIMRQPASQAPFFALAWTLATVASIGFLNRGYVAPYALPWGNALFTVVALTALALEILRGARRRSYLP